MKNGKRRDAIDELLQMSADLSKHTYLWTLFRPHCEPTTGLGKPNEAGKETHGMHANQFDQSYLWTRF